MRRRPLLTGREQEAVDWAKRSYPHWRKRFHETLAEHMTHLRACPDYYPEETKQRKREEWEYLFDHPFGDEEWNVHVQILHRLFAEGRL